MPKRTPREQIERAMHVSFKLPEQARAMLDAYRDQVLAEAIGIADTVVGPLWHLDTQLEITERLRAARTGQEG